MAATDLITAALATARLDLDDAQVADLPATIAAVSALIRNFTGRALVRRPSADMALGPVEEFITADDARGPIVLREYPVNEMFRVSAGPTAVLSIRNGNTITNQRATARVTRAGSDLAGYAPSAVVLDRWASGVKTTDAVLFSGLTAPTIRALADAVSALPGGWSATPASGYELWPVSELEGGGGAQAALGFDATCRAWARDLAYDLDPQAGLLTIRADDEDPFASTRWGPISGLEFGDPEITGQYRGIRVQYDAGYDPIPGDLADAAVEAVKAMFERKRTSATLLMERTDTWSYEAREVVEALPKSVRDVLALYRNHTR